MPRKVWAVQTAAQAHTVELDHGATSGRRSLKVDGAKIPLDGPSIRLFDAGGEHRFELDGKPVELHIQPVGFGRWYYRLKVDGVWLDDPLPETKTPAWALPFVLAALAPTANLWFAGSPALTLGLVGLVGVGGALGILANARDPLLRTESKILRCGLLAGAVWLCLCAPYLMMLLAMRVLNAGG